MLPSALRLLHGKAWSRRGATPQDPRPAGPPCCDGRRLPRARPGSLAQASLRALALGVAGSL
eukprot:8185096-Alexandrium_andersonii.AAC.1